MLKFQLELQLYGDFPMINAIVQDGIVKYILSAEFETPNGSIPMKFNVFHGAYEHDSNGDLKLITVQIIATDKCNFLLFCVDEEINLLSASPLLNIREGGIEISSRTIKKITDEALIILAKTVGELK